jgi:alpha-glucoside transport system substrate-binding protein
VPLSWFRRDTGWPGTDWIEDIVLRQSRPDVYDDWVAGRIPWTSPEIKSAFEFFGAVVNDAYGGPAGFHRHQLPGRRQRPFQHSRAMHLPSPGHVHDVVLREQRSREKGEYDFFPFPVLDERYANSVTGGGDLFGMFNDTPQSRALMSYLLTPEAQSIWVGRGGALSVNTKVTNYPDDISARSAQILHQRRNGSDSTHRT